MYWAIFEKLKSYPVDYEMYSVWVVVGDNYPPLQAFANKLFSDFSRRTVNITTTSSRCGPMSVEYVR